MSAKIPLHLEEIDVDGAPRSFKQQFGAEVPVLFIDGQKSVQVSE